MPAHCYERAIYKGRRSFQPGSKELLPSEFGGRARNKKPYTKRQELICVCSLGHICSENRRIRFDGIPDFEW